MTPDIKISTKLRQLFERLLIAYSPEEFCGLCTGTIVRDENNMPVTFNVTNFHWIDNIAGGGDRPAFDYCMEPTQQMSVITGTRTHKYKHKLTAIVHSHPLNQPIPSKYDQNAALFSGEPVPYLIIGKSRHGDGFELKAYFLNEVTHKFEPMIIEYTDLTKEDNERFNSGIGWNRIMAIEPATLASGERAI